MGEKVSIILTSYNKPKYLQKAIESVIQQTHDLWELFIMDDHSNEETTAVIHKYLHDRRIQYHNSFVQPADRLKTARYATLINSALPFADGDYISYLTDDTVYHPERLSRMVQEFSHQPEAQVVYSKQKVVHVNERGEEISHFYRNANAVLEQAAFHVDHCSVMHRRSLLNLIHYKYGGYWDDDMKHWNHGDAIFWARLNNFTPFLPINEVLDTTYKTPDSFQNAYRFLPADLIDGSFVKGSDQTVYFLDQGVRHPVGEKWSFWYLNRTVAVPDPYLFQYRMGKIINIPNYILVKEADHPAIFYIEAGKKRRIVDQYAFQFYQFQRKDILTVGKEELEALLEGPPIMWKRSELIKNPPGRRLFFIEREPFLFLNGFFHPISEQVARKFFLHQKPISASFRNIQQFPIGKPFYPVYDEIIKKLNIATE
ncbi:spore maturation glycosyltransferase CgeD [Bacillus stercoris]|uniref:spore maturation glycosyltransferase CgeD n=1 Tax=Bacillus TaxID=1386 RepID=UPI00249AC75D|nr:MULTISPECIES: spore maturation glycosyltransferase CgeD [Bacillus]MDN0190329.1 spore maturation glycosyltransferase CgeD [Bacillus sp. B.PNR1]MDN3033625.1 spore maturation glycosyltransferase CgeD [Bacillus sp. B.PNR2]WGV93668.1 spore maturation glycosyltransferase CgeD [Bacillus stercoris]WGV97451.1 spore maturation glycosyltransferase CgeD [Bacillus stercoris]